jgi:hypothetical protein
MLKPSLSRIERFIEAYEKHLAIASYVPPKWTKLVIDRAKRETPEGVIAAHIAAHPTDAGCSFITRVLCDGGYAVGR